MSDIKTKKYYDSNNKEYKEGSKKLNGRKMESAYKIK